MIKSEDRVVWVTPDDKVVRVTGGGSLPSLSAHPGTGHWYDPIGAVYGRWKSASGERARQMTETAIDMAMQATIWERSCGSLSAWREEHTHVPGADTAIVGKCLEPNTVPFGEMLVAYNPKEVDLG